MNGLTAQVHLVDPVQMYPHLPHITGTRKLSSGVSVVFEDGDTAFHAGETCHQRRARERRERRERLESRTLAPALRLAKN